MGALMFSGEQDDQHIQSDQDNKKEWHLAEAQMDQLGEGVGQHL